MGTLWNMHDESLIFFFLRYVNEILLPISNFHVYNYLLEYIW